MQEINQIERLYVLYQKGALTKSEFKTQKEEIINRFVNDGDRKSQLVYVIYASMFGLFGVHNFYLGRFTRGFFQLLPVFFMLLTLINPLFFVVGLIGISIVSIWILCNIWLIKTDANGMPLKPCKAAQYICGLICPILTLIFVIYAILT